MNLLSQAITLATVSHDGQVDKGGHPYILHPLRVMARCETDDERICAVLHDVVEDTPVTLNGLLADGYPAHIVETIDTLTRRSGEVYMDFIARVKKNELATVVKMLDIEDNMDLRRIPNPTEADRSRMDRYNKALWVLRE